MKRRMAFCGLVVAATVLYGCGGGGGNDVVTPGDENTPPVALQWAAVQRLPVSEFLSAVDGFGDTHIAVGDGGTIVLRRGNEDWHAVERVVDDRLSQVVVVSEKVALAVGGNHVLRTADAGDTWKVVATASGSLLDVSVRGDIAAAVGNDVILVSGDGGETWAPPSGGFIPLSYRFVSVQSATTITALAVGPNLFRSVDGGKNWSEIGVAELPETPTAFGFFSEKHGVAALRSPVEIYWTDDGGDTWTNMVSFGNGAVAALDIVDDTEAHAILQTGQVHGTTSAGKSWAFETLVPNEIGSVTGLDFSDAKGLIVTGPAGYVVESTNGGTTWAPRSSGRVGTFRSVAFADASTVVAAFTGGLDVTEKALRSVDGGATWDPVDPVMKAPARVVFGDGVGLLLGRDAVSRSLDGGATWTDMSAPANDPLESVAIFDAGTWVVCGQSNVVLRTADGGASWNAATVPTAGAVIHNDVDFFPGTDAAVIVGDDHGLRSADRGASWSLVNARGQAVACAGADVAVAVGNEILRSTDRGQVWSIIAVPDVLLQAVAFSGPLHGLAVGPGGFMLETLDGGASWTEVESGSSVELQTVTFSGPDAALAAGRFGLLLAGASQ